MGTVGKLGQKLTMILKMLQVVAEPKKEGVWEVCSSRWHCCWRWMERKAATRGAALSQRTDMP